MRRRRPGWESLPGQVQHAIGQSRERLRVDERGADLQFLGHHLQKRRGAQPDAVSRRAEDGGDCGRGAPFTGGAGDVDDRVTLMRIIEKREELGCATQLGLSPVAAFLRRPRFVANSTNET